MPVNKDELKRYMIIDRMLSDQYEMYTTEDIRKAVNREVGQDKHVILRTIQIDIKALRDDFGKETITPGKRGTVRYKDPLHPLFFKELTSEEMDILIPVLNILGGQFSGTTFPYISSMMEKFNKENKDKDKLPMLQFSKNDSLQVPPTLLSTLFLAISRKKVIEIIYTPFGQNPRRLKLYPYMLKQYNDRWYLLATPLPSEEFPDTSDFISNFALDRIDEKVEMLHGEKYVETKIDIEARFQEIIGVTLDLRNEVEVIYFAVKPSSVNFVKTKYLHDTQMELCDEELDEFKKKYPSLSDCAFFSMECRPNYELYSLFLSFGENIILLEPTYMREKIQQKINAAANNYSSLSE